MPLLKDMMSDWSASGENVIPRNIVSDVYTDYQYYMENLDITDISYGLVPDTTYFGLNQKNNTFVGAVNIRHYLNADLLHSGGHIGNGVRPSCRNKGFGTKMLALSLEKARELDIDKVLITCESDNIASARTIINNGGKLENEVLSNGVMVQRYWINLGRNYF